MGMFRGLGFLDAFSGRPCCLDGGGVCLLHNPRAQAQHASSSGPILALRNADAVPPVTHCLLPPQFWQELYDQLEQSRVGVWPLIAPGLRLGR